MAQTPIQTQGISAGKDQRGLVTVTIPVAPISLEEFLTFPVAIPFGTAETGRTMEDRGNGTYKLLVTCQGIDGAEGETETYEMDSSFAEEPIETHPDIVKLRKDYGGQLTPDGRIIFPETLTVQRNRNLSALTADNSTAVKNPMFGTTTWFSLKSIFRHTYLRKTIPGNLLNKIGTIEKRLPKGFPTPSGRNWLVMPPRVILRGNTYEISDEKMLSAPGGWNPGVYKFIR